MLTFVPNWNDNEIKQNMMRYFSRTHLVQEALNEYRESIKLQLQNSNTPYRVAKSRGIKNKK